MSNWWQLKVKSTNSLDSFSSMSGRLLLLCWATATIIMASSDTVYTPALNHLRPWWIAFSASFERRPMPTSAHNTRSNSFSRSLLICMFDNQSVQLKHFDAPPLIKAFSRHVCTEPLKDPDSLRRPWHLRPLSCWWWKRRIPKCSEEKCGNAKGMFYHNIRMHWYSVYMCPKSMEAWR